MVDLKKKEREGGGINSWILQLVIERDYNRNIRRGSIWRRFIVFGGGILFMFVRVIMVLMLTRNHTGRS